MIPFVNYLDKFVHPVTENYIPSRWVSIAWLPGFFTDTDGFKDGLFPTFWEVQDDLTSGHSPSPATDSLIVVRMLSQKYELHGENCGVTYPDWEIYEGSKYHPHQEAQSVVIQWLDRRPFFFVRGTDVNISDENSWPSIENLISGRFIPGGVCVPFSGGSVPFDFGTDEDEYTFTWEDTLTDFGREYDD